MSAMTDDDARDRFSDAIEGELSEGAKAAFDAALENSAELREEYESFRAMIRGAAKIAANTEAEADEAGVRDIQPELVKHGCCRGEGRAVLGRVDHHRGSGH